MRRVVSRFCILSGMLVVLPLLGVYLAGFPVGRYLEFPPVTRYLSHASFSWGAFSGYSILILVMVIPFLLKGLISRKQQRTRGTAGHHFPWWGWIGVLTGLIMWILAWTRFPWFSIFQSHTFAPLWLSYVVVVNGLTYKRDGRCMMIDRPGFFLLLFLVSAGFWWFFEYLNRFVQNWHYIVADYSPWEYFCYSTLSFSTVLPAVLGTREWMFGFSWLEKGLGEFVVVRPSRPRALAWTVLGISGAGLAGIGVWPDYLFPLLWVSPLLIIISLQTIAGESHVFSGAARGDWRLVIFSSLAALFCGLFWETWNYYSLAKWEYTIPFVDRYQLFEMPILGYAGYLPFGLECAAIGEIMGSTGQGVSSP